MIEFDEILRLIFSLGDMHCSVAECSEDLIKAFTGVVLPEREPDGNEDTGVRDLVPTGEGVLIPAKMPVADAGLGNSPCVSPGEENFMACIPSNGLVSEGPMTGNSLLCRLDAETLVAGTMMVVGCTSLLPPAGCTRTNPCVLLDVALGMAARYWTVLGTTCVVVDNPLTADTGIT